MPNCGEDTILMYTIAVFHLYTTAAYSWQVERKMLDLEEQHNLMLHHTHNAFKGAESMETNLAPPPLQPEDLDQPDVIDIIVCKILFV